MKNKEDLTRFRKKFADRYGKLTQEAKNLILTHRIRVEAKPLGVLKIDAGEDSIIFTFKINPRLTPESSSHASSKPKYAHARAESVTIRNLQ